MCLCLHITRQIYRPLQSVCIYVLISTCISAYMTWCVHRDRRHLNHIHCNRQQREAAVANVPGCPPHTGWHPRLKVLAGFFGSLVCRLHCRVSSVHHALVVSHFWPQANVFNTSGSACCDASQWSKLSQPEMDQMNLNQRSIRLPK